MDIEKKKQQLKNEYELQICTLNLADDTEYLKKYELLISS